MIIGIGCDLTDICRIEQNLQKFGQRFIERILSPEERKELITRGQTGSRALACTLAKRFAAKEACAKALGTGFSAGVSWQDMQVSHEISGRPLLTLRGQAQENLSKLCAGGSANIHISMSDDYPWAQAYVIIEAQI